MNVIITLAGHSRRFYAAGYLLPKFMIDINGAPMLKHVVQMFDTTSDRFFFIANKEQIEAYPQLSDLISNLANKTHLTVILSHELGPVWSCLQVADLPEDDETIICYCDFTVNWNYKLFKRQVYGYDGAIAAFQGFHPASFGKTFYAYLRVNDARELLELREKDSFTKERHNELASAGIYYFKNFKIFKHYGNCLMNLGFDGLKEGYVSLLFNLMVSDRLKVKVTKVEQFICWGTPEDLAQFQFWLKYFKVLPHNRTLFKQKLKQINLIPMAGLGNRYKEYGYRTIKPAIVVRNQPMVLSACESFPDADSWIFLAREETLMKNGFQTALKEFSSNYQVIPVMTNTTGQAATCLLSESSVPPNAALLIASCDYETSFNKQLWQNILDDASVDAVIWTYRMGAQLTKNPRAFAYCVVSDDGLTVENIVEKETISDKPELDPMVVGTFWFRRAEDFFLMAHQAIEKNIMVNGEHYIANSMNLLIESGKKVIIFDIDFWVSYGDPFELNVFNYWQQYFVYDKALEYI